MKGNRQQWIGIIGMQGGWFYTSLRDYDLKPVRVKVSG